MYVLIPERQYFHLNNDFFSSQFIKLGMLEFSDRFQTQLDDSWYS